MNRSRKHGVFAVGNDVVVSPSDNHEKKRDSLTIISALETVFQQMRIAETVKERLKAISTSLTSLWSLTSYITWRILQLTRYITI